MRSNLADIVWLSSFCFAWFCLPQPVAAQADTLTPEPGSTQIVVPTAQVLPGISFPADGAVLAGSVDILGSADASWDVAFSYNDDPGAAWFLIDQSAEPALAGTIGTWDTRDLTDGSYILRLRVWMAEGVQEYKVSVLVRNSSATETIVPTQTLTVTPVPASTITFAFDAESDITPTFPVIDVPDVVLALPPNPVTLDPEDIFTYFGKGVLAVVGVFALVGIFFSLRRK